MASVLVAPELETFPNRKRWTREECYALREEGRISGRWELIDGEIISKMGQKPPHCFALNLTSEWLVSLFGFRHVRIQEPISIPGVEGEWNEPEPDIAVTRDAATAYANRHPSATDLLLIVEISDSSRTMDLGVKTRLYALAGVPEYWVIDLPSRRLHRHVAAGAEGYGQVTFFEAGDEFHAPARPESSTSLSRLLPEEGAQ